MEKITLMAATVVSATALAGTSISTQAAGVQSANINSGNIKFIHVEWGCNVDNLLSQLENCFPGIQLPVLPELPDTDHSCPIIPDIEIPSPEAPDIEVPSPEIPDTEAPSPEIPDTEAPSPEIPDTEAPSPEIPDTETPSPEMPDAAPGPELPNPETPSPEKPELESPSPEQPEQELSYTQQIINLVNEERAKEGLAPLTLNKAVAAAAQIRAREIVTSFSHTRPNGTSFATALKEQNINYRRAGENIAWGQKSPEEVVNAWMNSSGHRANIMNPNFTSIGVGYYQVNGVKYWCQLFIA